MFRLLKGIAVKCWYFIWGEYFIEALKTTIVIVSITAFFFWTNKPGIAIASGLGVMLASLPDQPRTIKDRVRIMTISCVLLPIIALISCYAVHYTTIMAILLLVSCFSFSMIAVFGSRLYLLGSSVIVLVLFVMGLRPGNGLVFALHIGLGCVWYLVVSSLVAFISPERPLRFALGEFVCAEAQFLRNKGAFYDPTIPIDICYQRGLKYHEIVIAKQKAVNDMIKSYTSHYGNDDSSSVECIHAVSKEIKALHAQVLSIEYDHHHIRTTLGESGLLQKIKNTILLIASEMDSIGTSFKTGLFYAIPSETDKGSQEIRKDLKALTPSLDDHIKLIMSGFINNLTNIEQHLRKMKNATLKNDHNDYCVQEKVAEQFLIFDIISVLQTVKSKMIWSSLTFKFSIRLAAVCVVTYLLMVAFPIGKYNYWVLLTIVFVMRPLYGTTRQRNIERVLGTLSGILLMLGLMLIVQSTTAQIILVILLLLGYLSFLRVNYMISVICVTGIAVLGIHILYGGLSLLVLERFYDTIIGCTISLLAGFLFPHWESKQIDALLRGVVKANISYLEYFNDCMLGHTFDEVKYQNLRNHVFSASADLSATASRFSVEPGTRNLILHIYNFQVTVHKLFSAATSLFGPVMTDRLHLYTKQATTSVGCAVEILKSAENLLESKRLKPGFEKQATGSQIQPEASIGFNFLLNLARRLYEELGNIYAEMVVNNN
ncbi:FUSC family protein [Mucilaginibacter sp. ZT4R22]|uniref:FUSC family protein n=1 Tax=Mucilaginibacter pankratovii TaxID=2772110 RepID=A0ABR7WWC3_9SPHI|nr:FUSC family membrane protein [Mucilaginibacter pankratovii]MBD1366584.1 FUSC family protein [Mucilaginibacter pankratovii]